MSPAQFKSRYIASLPATPPELDLHLDAFSTFPASLVEQLDISDTDRSILIGSGLPENAPPFLHFRLSPSVILQPLSSVCGDDTAFERYYMIGQNGSGDMICIDQESNGAVVYLNHDWEMRVVFMNSNVTALAESLCDYIEYLKTKDADACRRAIRKADPAAMAPGSFWSTELENNQCE